MAVENPVKDRGILPDIEVWPSVNDILYGKDVEMDQAILKIGK
jgi:hypothetical protein